MTGKEAEAAERLDAARTAARLGCSVGNLTKRQREMLVAKVCLIDIADFSVVFGGEGGETDRTSHHHPWVPASGNVGDPGEQKLCLSLKYE